jgi:hypothetical protein
LEKTVFPSAAMTPSGGKYYTKLTAAWLRDTGWYLTNDDLVMDLEVGRGAGCNLLNDF